MSKFGVEMKIKDAFFDRQKVIDKIGRANAKRLSKAGAFIKQRAKTSLRRRKSPSRPGSPPSVHSRSSYATLRNIWFALGDDHNSVVIGPLNVSSLRLKNSSASTVPELMEFGGTSEIDGKRARYPARPFMGPAMKAEIEAGKIGDFWGA